MEKYDKEELTYNTIKQMILMQEFREKSIKNKRNLKLDYDYLEIIDYLNKFDYVNNSKIIKRKNFIDINKYFFNNYLHLQNINLIKNKEVINSTPFNLKIKTIDRENYGKVILDFGSYEEYVFCNIEIGKNYTTNSIGIYAHELTHTQLEGKMGINLTNYFNRELLSIFLEKVIMYELSNDNLEEIQLMRLNMLKAAIKLYSENNWLNHGKDACYIERSYIVSTFMANHLFDIYSNSDNKGKERILKFIDRIFKKETTVENLMRANKVTYNNSKTLKYVK